MLLKTIEFSFDSFVFHGTVGVKANRSFYLAKNIKICYTYDSLYRVQTLRGAQENRPIVSAASGVNFEIYNEIIKNDLPIKFICNPDDDSLEHGWFVYNNTLIIPNVFSFEYNPETKKWNYCCEVVEEDDTEKRIIMSLDEYMETEVQEANELAGDTICDKAIVLIDANCIENVELAKNENNFLIYDDNREEVLKTYCGNS